MPKHATPSTIDEILAHQIKRRKRIAFRRKLDAMLNPPSPNELPSDWHALDNDTRIRQWYERSTRDAG